MYKKIIFMSLMSFMIIKGYAQNEIEIDKIKGTVKDKIKETLKSKPIKITGSLAVNAVATVGSVQNPQPFTYVANGNVNIALFGYSLPFSFTYSNRQFSYANPSFQFNRTAFNPKFKKWTGHFGDVSMTLSPYTLSGFQFKGAGIEYLPDKWKFQILGGRFLKGVAEDSSGRVTPSYYRLGTGLKAGYYGDKAKLGLSVFYAKDDAKSIPVPLSINYYEVRPMENLAFAIEAGVPIGEKLSLETEISTSVLTKNMLASDNEVDLYEAAETSPLTKLLSSHNPMTQVYHAIKTGLNYKVGKTGTIGLAYERVDPRYRTLGGHYFTNDFENITVNTAFQGKVNTQFSTGLQRDDLGNTGTSNLNRMVVSANMSFKPSEKMDMSLNYSNFQSYTFIRSPFDRINQTTPFDNLDTLNFTQLSQNGGMNMSYNIKQDDKGSQVTNLSINLMESANERNQGGGQNTQFINTSMNYAWSFTKKLLNISAGLNYSLNLGQSSSLTWGPILSATKQLFNKKVATNYALSYNRNKASDILSQVVNMSVGANTKIKKKHNFTANMALQYRTVTQRPALFNATLTLGYNYTF
jgi:hypothetical protein